MLLRKQFLRAGNRLDMSVNADTQGLFAAVGFLLGTCYFYVTRHKWINAYRASSLIASVMGTILGAALHTIKESATTISAATESLFFWRCRLEKIRVRFQFIFRNSQY